MPVTIAIGSAAAPRPVPMCGLNLDPGSPFDTEPGSLPKESRPVAGAASSNAGGSGRRGGPQSAAARRSSLPGRLPYSA